MRPSPEVNRIVNYAVLLNCQRNADDLDVTAYCALSNHHHFVITDPRGGADSKVSAFCRDVHALIAKSLNSLQDCSGVVWDPNTSFHNVEIHGFEAEVAQWVYVAGQAVAAGLVERPEDWPGICWLPQDVGRVLTVERPDVLYSTAPQDDPEVEDEALREAQARLKARLAKSAAEDRKRGRSRRRTKRLTQEREARGRAQLPQPAQRPRSSLPKRVSYRVPVPKCLRGTPLPQVRAYLQEALDTYVAKIHAQRAAEGLGFVGVANLEDQDPHSPPQKARIDTDHRATYRRGPRLATKGLLEAEVRELKSELRQWYSDHHEGVEAMLRSPKPHRAIFPKGTHRGAQELRRLRAAYSAQAPPRAA